MDELKSYIRTLPKDELVDLFIRYIRKEPEVVKLPVSIYQARLSSLELAVKYMKEDLGYSNKKIALMLNRSPQNIWVTYRNAKMKYPARLSVMPSPYDIPIEKLADKRYSMLESIVKYMREAGLSNGGIARLLHRDKKTISTVYHRVQAKIT